MQVSLDGGLNYQEVREGVRIIFEDQLMPGEDENGDLQINISPEGIVYDAWVTREKPGGEEDHNIATDSETITELLERLVEKNA